MHVLEGQAARGRGAQATSFWAWTRNVSAGGLSFVYPRQIQLERILVCLPPGAARQGWVHADVVRRRAVLEGFWEYGVIFRQRVVMDGSVR